jgi:hypothetical protein
MRRSIVAAVLAVALVTPVPLATPAVAVGHGWRTTLHYKWSGYHRYGKTAVIMRANGTFVLREGGHGTWRLNRSAHRLVLRMATGCDPVYRGTTHGMRAAGTMRCGHYHGKWFIDRLRPA